VFIKEPRVDVADRRAIGAVAVLCAVALPLWKHWRRDYFDPISAGILIRLDRLGLGFGGGILIRFGSDQKVHLVRTFLVWSCSIWFRLIQRIWIAG
jgi:hypothetical protein